MVNFHLNCKKQILIVLFQAFDSGISARWYLCLSSLDISVAACSFLECVTEAMYWHWIEHVSLCSALYSWHRELLPLELVMLWTLRVQQNHPSGSLSTQVGFLLCCTLASVAWNGFFSALGEKKVGIVAKAGQQCPLPGSSPCFHPLQVEEVGRELRDEPGTVPVLGAIPRLPSAWLAWDGAPADLSFPHSPISNLLSKHSLLMSPLVTSVPSSFPMDTQSSCLMSCRWA